jgi:NaMN:DMB phosphoribosyltransferase
MKKPAGIGAGGLGVSDLSGRLHQAMAVRRHGGSMMVVMAGMAVALHLYKT